MAYRAETEPQLQIRSSVVGIIQHDHVHNYDTSMVITLKFLELVLGFLTTDLSSTIFRKNFCIFCHVISTQNRP